MKFTQSPDVICGQTLPQSLLPGSNDPRGHGRVLHLGLGLDLVLLLINQMVLPYRASGRVKSDKGLDTECATQQEFKMDIMHILIGNWQQTSESLASFVNCFANLCFMQANLSLKKGSGVEELVAIVSWQLLPDFRTCLSLVPGRSAPSPSLG